MEEVAGTWIYAVGRCGLPSAWLSLGPESKQSLEDYRVRSCCLGSTQSRTSTGFLDSLRPGGKSKYTKFFIELSNAWVQQYRETLQPLDAEINKGARPTFVDERTASRTHHTRPTAPRCAATLVRNERFRRSKYMQAVLKYTQVSYPVFRFTSYPFSYIFLIVSLAERKELKPEMMVSGYLGCPPPSLIHTRQTAPSQHGTPSSCDAIVPEER